ncbi:hypothetical protein IFM89_024003 [Coptis chinensis]|uniref:SUF system FeS cluster assembly SufBD core domain-containing protein n=1 Tax=Coptis chinensis TaxID=261450 RepID=A0A835H4U8_9MAGN|nr:hypothetical protein IFM89_024003 [Coptis chinensis]
MLIQTYFWINDMETGHFESTLIVADEGSKDHYLDGCTVPSSDINQLHASVVELYTEEGAEIKYSIVQNWYAVDEEGRGGTTLSRSVVFVLVIAQRYCGLNDIGRQRTQASSIEHEASTSKVNEDQLFYFLQRGIGHDKAVKALISGFCQEVVETTLPLEVRAELQEYTGIKLDRSVG